MTHPGSVLGDLPAISPVPAAADPEFDQMAVLTKRVMRAPIATVTVVTRDCQIFPGIAGMGPELEQTRANSLRYSICQYVVRAGEPFVVDDTSRVDALADNLSVIEHHIAAYAGMPLVDAQGAAFGSLCVMDVVPRHWTPDDLEILEALAASCSAQFQLREANSRAAVSAERDRIARDLTQGVIRELFGLSMALGHARSQAQGDARGQLGAAMETVDSVIKQVRDSVFDVAA